MSGEAPRDLSECVGGWLHPSCIAVGGDQQFVSGVMTPPAQHHAGTEHPKHLQAGRTAKGEKLSLKSSASFSNFRISALENPTTFTNVWTV